jgi:hypothetical protein
MTMTTPVTLEQVATLATQLSLTDRLRLVERIVHDLAVPPAANELLPGYDWSSLRGIAPNLLGGEDAQAWVSRTRREGDEQREQPWRREQ